MFRLTKEKLSAILPWLMVFTGGIGFVFAFLLTVEKFFIMVDPTHMPPCSIDPFLSCKSVMETPQAAIFGFPNSLIGITGFAIILTIAFSLLAGAQYKKWFWKWTQGGVTLAVIFIYWLFYQSVFEIAALCLYCIGVWIVMIPLFWYVTTYNILHKNIKMLSYSWSQKCVKSYHLEVLFVMYAVIFMSILLQFWDYWMTYFT